MKDKPQNSLNHKKIASKTAHFSGADLEQLVGDAIESVLQRSLEMGELQPLTNNDLSEALSRRKPTTLEWFSTAKNYATFSDVNKDYQQVLDYLKENKIR